MAKGSARAKIYMAFVALVAVGSAAFYAFALGRAAEDAAPKIAVSQSVESAGADAMALIEAQDKAQAAQDPAMAMGAAIEELDRAISAASVTGGGGMGFVGPVIAGVVALALLGVIWILARLLLAKDEESETRRAAGRASVTFDSRVLSKGQDASVEFMNIFFADPLPSYDSIAPLLDNELREKFTEEKYEEFLGSAKDKFGEMLEVKFIAFERLDAYDQLTYFARFSKENMVVIRMGFSKRGRIVYFRLEPYAKKAETPMLNK